MGPNPFISIPQGFIKGTSLVTTKTVTYLGTVFGDKTGKAHCENRCRAASCCFYALQRAGIMFPGVCPSVALDLYNIGVRSSLIYGCVSMFMTKSLQNMDKLQNKLIKQCLGLN